MSAGCYIAFDSSQRPLYVGASSDVASRVRQHRSRAEWWSDVADIEVRPTATVAEAFAMEARLIEDLTPAHNQRRGRECVEQGGSGAIRLRENVMADCLARWGNEFDVASALGVTQPTVNRVRRGAVAPSNKFLAGLMHATGLGFDDLFEVVGSAA